METQDTTGAAAAPENERNGMDQASEGAPRGVSAGHTADGQPLGTVFVPPGRPDRTHLLWRGPTICRQHPITHPNSPIAKSMTGKDRNPQSKVTFLTHRQPTQLLDERDK